MRLASSLAVLRQCCCNFRTEGCPAARTTPGTRLLFDSRPPLLLQPSAARGVISTIAQPAWSALPAIRYAKGCSIGLRGWVSGHHAQRGLNDWVAWAPHAYARREDGEQPGRCAVPLSSLAVNNHHRPSGCTPRSTVAGWLLRYRRPQQQQQQPPIPHGMLAAHRTLLLHHQWSR